MDYKLLVKDCLQHNAIAQKRLYEVFAPAMLGVCYRYTKSINDAEDVLQEGFIKVFRFLETYKSEGELGAWIRRIMVTTALNYLKKTKSYRNELIFEEMPLYLVSYNNPQVQLDTRELGELIRKLPTGFQTVFNLYAIEGYSHAEIGELLGISSGTSKSQYARARYLLIQWIEKYSSLPKNEQYAGK